MSINQDKVDRIICERENGRVTYLVAYDGKPARAICSRQMTDGSGEYCSQPAGFKTDHPGEGACCYHGGGGKMNLRHGRYAKIAKGKLAKHLTVFQQEEQEALLDLEPELALQRTLLQEALDMYEEDPKDPQQAMDVFYLIRGVAEFVKAIVEIESKHVLRRAEGLYLMANALRVCRQFIAEKDLPKFIQAWREETTRPPYLEPGPEDDFPEGLEEGDITSEQKRIYH